MKKKKSVFLIFIGMCLTFLPNLKSQCPDDDFIIIGNNQELESLSQKFINCDSIKGNLSIMSSVSKIDSTIFPNLIFIGGFLNVAGNDSLKEIKGFKNLKSVELLSIRHNKSLIEVSGFDSLTYVGTELQLYYNESLLKISGFGNLKTVGERVIISTSPKLAIIEAFDNLETVQEIEIFKLKSIKKIKGFEKVKKIKTYISLQVNEFTEIPKFESLESDKNKIRIRLYIDK